MVLITSTLKEPSMPRSHNVKGLPFGVVLGLATLYNLWRPRDSRIALDSALVTASAYHASAYHASQLTAGLYPGTATVDPPGKDNWPQLWTTLPVLRLHAMRYALERRRLTREAPPR